MKQFNPKTQIGKPAFSRKVAEYIFQELSRSDDFIISTEAATLYQDFLSYLSKKKGTAKFNNSINDLKDQAVDQFQTIRHWLLAYIMEENKESYKAFIDEATVLLACDAFDSKNIVDTEIRKSLEGFHGTHSSVDDGSYQLDYNGFIQKLENYERDIVPKFKAYGDLKKKQTENYRKQLRLETFKPKVLSSFIRNKLIDQVYLPIIGDNLAKQIGTADESTRTDRMGLLLLISPPGYGKTTLMEYIANRLGLIFMKINGPAIGYEVTSLDPGDAPNRAARQELEKLNLSFEMGNNIMIYLDDIQHCSPEFLQKFISLCDAQRKIEGIWKGESKTYDFRGKRVCIVMAGNPYTESGERFQVPDMLSNRADIYNLGDIIGDNQSSFELSYIENCLSSNPTLSKLALKSMADVYTLIEICQTGNRENISFKANHSPEDLNEYLSVLEKLFLIRDVILKVNQEYIRSATITDAYRQEPPFKLQGSYRNMNKLAEKIVPIMNRNEIDTLLISHYEGEAQTLTSDAEHNLLKFKELAKKLQPQEATRWQEIKKTYNKNKVFSGLDEESPVAQVVAQLKRFTDELEDIKEVLQQRMKK